MARGVGVGTAKEEEGHEEGSIPHQETISSIPYRVGTGALSHLKTNTSVEWGFSRFPLPTMKSPESLKEPSGPDSQRQISSFTPMGECFTII